MHAISGSSYLRYPSWSGGYMTPQFSSASTTGAVTAGRLYLAALDVDWPCRVDRVQFEVTVAGAIGTMVANALYYSTPDGKPSRLLATLGAALCDVVVVQSIDFLPVSLAPGRYWLGSVSDGVPTLRMRSTTTAVLSGSASVVTTAIALVYDGIASVVGGFPPRIADVYPVPQSALAVTNQPMQRLRVV